jgi:outer membrane protein assembly factor BamB
MGGYVYVTVTNPATTHPNLYAINYRTGATAWGPIDLGGSFWANAAYDNGFVFTINSTGQMQAFDDLTGAVQWTSQLPGQSTFTSPPAGSYFATRSDLIYTSGGGSGGTLYAVHESTGALAWQAPVMNGDHSAPVVTRSGVYVSYACAQTYDFEPLRGTLLWHHTSTCSGGGGKTAALYDGKLYVRDAIVGNTVLDASTGLTLGSFSATTAPAFSGATGFFLSGSTLQAVDLGSKAVLWSFTGDGSLSTAPIVVNGNVFIGSTTGNIYAVDATTGKQGWSAHLNSAISGPDEQNASQPLTGLSAAAGFLAVPAGNTLTLFGSAVQIAPGNVDFGIHGLGSTTYAPVGLHVNFGGNVTISSITASGDYTVSYGACTTLAVGGDCRISVGFTPTANGQRNGTLTINDDAPGGPHAVTLTGVSTIGVVDHLVLNPSWATVAAAGSQAYEADGYDVYGDYVGNFSARTSFNVSGGSCTGNVCTSTRAGDQVVAGLYTPLYSTGYAYGSATLNVTPGPLDHITVSPDSGVSITAGGARSYATEGFDQYGNDLGSATAVTTFTIGPDGSCTLANCTATVAGPHTVTATDGSKTAMASLTVTAGPIASLTISPGSATITAGGSQTYTASGTDKYGNNLGDVTAGTGFTISPADGSCNQSTQACTATATGPHTVTGTSYGPSSATATLNVNPGPLDHITISSNISSIQAGGANYYTVREFDQFGNQPAYPGPTSLSISPDGSCTPYSCTANIVGVHTVTALDTGKTATVTLTVTPGPVATLTIAPTSTTITAGGSATYTATATDQYGNSIGDVTAATAFGIAPDGTCSGVNCTATKAGSHTVTGTNNGKTGAATLAIGPAAFDHIALSPVSATINAGGSQSYATEAFDVYGNDLGDQTAASVLSITPDGACTTASCSATHWGNHTITASYSGKSVTASLMVNPSPVVASIGLNPGTYNIPAGVGATFYLVTIDQYGNSIAVVNSGFNLTVGPPTTGCPGSTCTVTKAGTYTITATYQGFTSTGQLVIRPAALDHITLTPATATIVAGSSQAYAVEGFDQYGNDIGSMASSTYLSVNGYSCSNMSCQAYTAGDLTVTATSGGKTATATLTVKPGPIARLAVSPPSVTLPVQASQIFTASGSDAYSNPVSVSGATWSLASRTPGTLASTTGGTTTFKASIYFTGTGSVTATISGISASATITVIPATPSNLTANVKPTKVDLTWNTAAGAYTYAVYRGTSSSNLALLKSGLTSTSFTDAPGSGTFYYYVVAVGPSGQTSAPSNIVGATFK